MPPFDSDKTFSGSIAPLYETHLVPLLFAPYADELANRLARKPLGRVLELAAGTGVVTRALGSVLPERVSIVSTDLNQSMLDEAMTIGTSRPIEWRQADAMALPFDDESFDAVVCQFGVMFFPDKQKAFSEARRVLRPGGLFLFSVWDRIETNEFADVVGRSVEPLFPDDPPRFLTRTPYGYHDVSTIQRDLAGGGFGSVPTLTTVTARSRAASARLPAIGFCQGTPLRNEIESRRPDGLAEATDVATEAIAQRFGHQAVDGQIQAHVVTIQP
ncbi:MAG: class I SAM-dependent methyltransferase [Vicinamibacterales bacterium]